MHAIVCKPGPLAKKIMPDCEPSDALSVPRNQRLNIKGPSPWADNDQTTSPFSDLLRIMSGQVAAVWPGEKEHPPSPCLKEERIGLIRKFLTFPGLLILRAHGNLWMLTSLATQIPAG